MTEALSREKGKAEIVDGRIVRMSPTGGLPSKASLAIASSLRSHARAHGGGHAFADNAGFLVDLPGRQSFSPDAAWYTGTVVDMRFLEGAPALAEIVIRAYRASAPDTVAAYRRGDVAEAEPAVPGWRFPVDELFE
jgi:Uma2 family endonuclease